MKVDSEPRLALVGHGGLYLALLPLLLTNITPHWALTHPFGNTALVVAERGAGGLMCLSWCGVPPAANDLHAPRVNITVYANGKVRSGVAAAIMSLQARTVFAGRGGGHEAMVVRCIWRWR